MREMMIDIETLDVKPEAVVLQIGCVIFEDQFSEQRVMTFHERDYNLDVTTQIEAGRTISWETLKFWMSQADDSRQSVIADDECEAYAGNVQPNRKLPRWPAWRALQEIDRLAVQYDVKAFWAKGSFDFTILEHLASQCNPNKLPWTFRSKYDLRTLLSLAPHVKDLPRNILKQHTGMMDCHYQIEQLLEVRRHFIVSPPAE